MLTRAKSTNSNVWLLEGIAAKLCSMDEVEKLLSALDNSKHCVGNPEAKLMHLVPGIFGDQSGKLLNTSLLK